MHALIDSDFERDSKLSDGEILNIPEIFRSSVQIDQSLYHAYVDNELSIVTCSFFKISNIGCMICDFKHVGLSVVFLFQSNLSSKGDSQMERDFRLVENEGLFQEYLEMG